MAKEEIKEIIVHTQEELDAVPEDFKGRVVLLDFKGIVNPYGERFKKIRAISSDVLIYNGYVQAIDSSVTAFRETRVEASGTSSIVTCGRSRVEAYDKTTVIAKCDSYAILHDHTSARATDYSTVSATDYSTVSASDCSLVFAEAYSKVYASGCSTVKVVDQAKVSAGEDSRVDIFNEAEAYAYDRAQVICNGFNIINAYDLSTIIVSKSPKRITANGFSTVWCTAEQLSRRGLITLQKNARVVLHPRNIEEFCDAWSIETEGNTGLFYKAVRKLKSGTYVSDYDRTFVYEIGKKVTSACDPDTSIECGEGIHIANLRWAYEYGSGWHNMAILELKVDLDKIVVPVSGCGKVRTPEATVIREVDIDEVLRFR